MSNRNHIEWEMRQEVLKNPDKAGGKLTNDETVRQYYKHIGKFCDWAREMGIERINQIERNGFTKQSLIQKYADTLKNAHKSDGSSLKATTIHTYLAPVCSGLGVNEGLIDMPRRMSADIAKNTKLEMNAQGAREMESPSRARLVELCRITGVRPTALIERASVNCIVKDEALGQFFFRIKDKGGKISNQLITPEEAMRARAILSTNKDGEALKDGEKPFDKAERGKMALSALRIERAQRIEAYFERQFNAWKHLPRSSASERAYRESEKEKAQKSRQEWIENLCKTYEKFHPSASSWSVENFRLKIEATSRYGLRGGNRERAKELGRPLSYDRVALSIASVFALSHWSDESTIRNYLTK